MTWAAMAGDVASVEPWPRRTSEASVELVGDTVRVHIYRPKRCAEGDGPLMFVFAGYERNAEDYLKRARRIARERCMTVFAPDLDSDRFPRALYQRGGISKTPDDDGETCIGLVLRQLVDWARTYVGRDDAPYVLFGHSAGAQMLSRVTAFCPLPDAERIVIANPSSHVAPSLVERAPFGFGGVLDIRERDERLRAYLAQPITIYLGTADTGDGRLDAGAAAQRQGRNRLERGRNVFEQGREFAERRGWAFGWRIVFADGVGHSSKGMLHAPEMREALATPPR